MNSKYSIFLTDKQRSDLDRIIHSGSCPARRQNRARILLLADRSQGQSMSDIHIAEQAMVSPGTVFNIRRRFVQNGLEAALLEKPRPGRPPKITGDVEAKLIVLACSDPPEGHAHWSLRLLTGQLIASGAVEDLSHVAVRTALKKTNLNPGRSRLGASANRRPGM